MSGAQELPIVLKLWAHDAPNSGVDTRGTTDEAADIIKELYEALRDSANALQNLATRVTDHGSSPELRAKQAVLQEQASAAFSALAKARGEQVPA
jgi:uncharacterized protein YoxC